MSKELKIAFNGADLSSEQISKCVLRYLKKEPLTEKQIIMKLYMEFNQILPSSVLITMRKKLQITISKGVYSIAGKA